MDISEVVESKRPLRNKAFDGMEKLRYLKIYNSCTNILTSDSKFIIGNGLEFPFEEVRYLHWLKFPLEELPKDFSPNNLVDLKLPYSHIKRLWNDGKVRLYVMRSMFFYIYVCIYVMRSNFSLFFSNICLFLFFYIGCEELKVG